MCPGIPLLKHILVVFICQVLWDHLFLPKVSETGIFVERSFWNNSWVLPLLLILGPFALEFILPCMFSLNSEKLFLGFFISVSTQKNGTNDYFNKIGFAKFVEHTKIPFPKTFSERPNGMDVVMKPKYGFGGKDVIIVRKNDGCPPVSNEQVIFQERLTNIPMLQFQDRNSLCTYRVWTLALKGQKPTIPYNHNALYLRVGAKGCDVCTLSVNEDVVNLFISTEDLNVYKITKSFPN